MKRSIGKILLSWLLVVSMIIPSLSYVIHTQAADGDIKDYDAMTMEQILASDESLTWVITGDSITHNGGWTAGLNSYGEWMEQYLYDSGRGDDSVMLTGWGGAATDDFQTVANTNSGQGTKADPGMGIENFITKYNPDVITIKLGMNDRYIAKATFIKYYKQMLDSIYSICETQYKKIPKIVVLTPSPIASENHLDDIALGEVPDGVFESTSRQRNALEQIVKDYNAAGKHILFCDLRTAFLNEEQAIGADYAHTFFQDPSDGAIHPNGAGQYLIFKTLAKTLGIYDESMPIFQIQYEDLVSHALFVDSTDGLTYTGDYGQANIVDDSAEMNKTMPTLSGVNAISSVEFTSDNGTLDMGNREGFSISTESEGVDTLTQAEATALTDTFSVVFRARLGSAYHNNQPVLFVSSNGTANWQNALVLGVPGETNQLYFNAKAGGMTLKTGTINLNSGTTVAGDGNWHTIATVYNQGTLKYYVDGTQVGADLSGYGLKDGVTSLGSLFANSADFQAQIGRYGITTDGTTYKLNGMFDYWQLYGEALSAEQVATLASDEAESVSWSDAVVENYTWAIAGGAQMATYDGNVVNRSLMRYIENAMRGSSGVASYRDIHMFNFASADYDVAALVEKYDTLAEERAYNVFMLLPEIPEIYESNYVHSAEKVAAYKNNIRTLLNENSGKVLVLWTPLASNDATINGYIDDYAKAVREIATSDTTILFFDANQFMNDSMEANASLLNNWFEEGQYVSPLCNVDVTRAFYETVGLSNTGKGELSAHNLRYASDAKIYKGKYVRDNIAATATVSGTTVSVDVSAIKTAYPNAELSIVVLPHKTVENYNENIVKLADVATVSVSGNVYTFEAPCADLNLAIYGEQNGLIYRFKDISLDVETTATIPEAKADGVYLDSLEVMSAPALEFNKNTTTYNVDLYQYQSYASVRATAQAGLTIKVNGEVVASGAIAKAIKVEDGSVVTVEVTDGIDTKTYTLNMSRPNNPDIIITEVMTDGYSGYTASGNDNYELIEIYNASGKDLNLLDYSVGYKKDYTYNTVNIGNGAEFPYYFTGNDLAVSKETHAGIKELTKYSMYWEDKVDEEPKEVLFKADSTMVIWVKFSPVKVNGTTWTEAQRKSYGAELTYETLIAALEAHKGTHTLSVDIDGTETAVVPKESQIVVAEAAVESGADSISSAAGVTAENSQKNWYLENHGKYNAGGQQTRSWLFILKDTSEIAQNYKVTEAGNDIISAAKYVRPGSTNKLSSVFSYNSERGMSLVRNESYINDSLVGKANTSDVMGYSNLTSFGAIEYWQKPADFGDTTKPTVTDATVDKEVAVGSEVIINLDLADETDVRYATVYARKAGEKDFTAYAKDFVLEAGVKNVGISTDITDITYAVSLGAATGSVEYYAEVVDGNGNVGTLGNAEEPLVINELPKVIDTYLVADAKEYIGDEAPTCEHEGFLFSGWYADAECKNTPIASDADANNYEKVYALFVSEDVLGVKGQLIAKLTNTDATDDEKGIIRFVTSVDSEWYREVGFNVSYDLDGDGQSETVTRSSKKAYEKLVYVNSEQEGTMDYYPDKEFSPISKYFKACTVKNLSEDYYDVDFTVEPFWITPDGMTVKATPQIKRVNDGIAVHYEAKDDTTYYPVLEDAVNAANTASKDSTITVFKDAEVECAMTVSTNVTIQNRVGRDITVYRGTGLATTNMFTVAQGATLKIAGVEDMDSIVLDGRTVTDSEAGKKVTEATGSTGAIVSNSGTVEMKNMTAQYARRTKSAGAVILNAESKGAIIKTDNAKFSNNSADADAGGVFYTGGGNGKSELKNTIFESNYAKKNGGVIGNYSPLEITNCKFTDNIAEGQGGVIYSGGSQVVTFTGGNDEMAIISGNKTTATTGYGGAVTIGSGKVEITDYKFDGNTATSLQGGAIYVTGSGSNYSTITGCEFVNNTAKEAGALHVGNSGKVNVYTSEFTTNSATTNGGAVSSNGGGAYNIYTSTFTENSATTNGGAIYVDSTGTILIEDSEFKDNTAKGNNGGAMYVTKNGNVTVNNTDFNDNHAISNKGGAMCTEGGKVIFNTCNFIGNDAKSDGGAIRMAGNSGSSNVSITGGTFSGNESGDAGGAIKFNSGKLMITNVIFNGNTATNGGNAISTNGAGTTLTGCTLKKSDISGSYIGAEDGTNTWVTE